MSNDTNSSPRQLGATGPAVFPIGLGCMGMSGMYGAADENESIATIHAALDAGLNLFDTGDFYSIGRNEMLLGRALRGRREQAVVSVKFGALRAPDQGWIGYDCRPAAVKNALAHSLSRLGLDYVDIYRPARVDPSVPIEDTIGAIAEMVQAGYVKHIGLSEMGVETIRRAHGVHPICDLQIEYSLISRGPEAKILPALAELGIGLTAYGVLSRGLLAGSKPTGPGDFRAFLPRFSGAAGERNAGLVETLRQMAEARGIKASQLAIAWVLGQGKGIVPVVGSRTRVQLADALGALQVELSPADLAELAAALPPEAVAGERYAPAQMAHLDSER